MGTEGDPPVPTGPPPEPSPASRPTDGSIAATGAPADALASPTPRGVADPAEAPPLTATGASAPPAAGPLPGPGAATPALQSQGASDDASQVVLRSADVFADIDEEGTDPNPPISRRFHEDGDAEMEGSNDHPAKKPFRSDLQTQARNAKRTGQDDWKTVSRQRRPAQDGRRVPPPRRQTRSKASVPPGARAQKTPQQTPRSSAPSTVWSTQGAAQLRATLRGTDTLQTHQPDGAQNQAVNPALSPYYDCATRAANLRFDGDQRALTKLEQVTLYKWMNREIHLSGPPRFFTETHTSAEQDVFADYDRNHMDYRLYGILPAGITHSEENSKYHFCNTALLANRDAPTRSALENMFMEAQVITSEPKSKVVVLRYVRPEQRDQWCGFTFKMRSGTITMQATDSLTTDVPRVGMDDNARALLYHVHARGHSSLSHATVRAVFAKAANMAVFDVRSVDSLGLADFSTHKWEIAFAQITCPPALASVRRLDVRHGAERLVFDIQHPRATRRAPCTKCLSIRHGTADCNNKQAQQSLLRHTLTIDVEPATPLPKLTAAVSPPSLKLQLRQLRQLAAPELADRLRQEKKERKAEAKKQVAQAAAHVAKEAAREARLVAAAKCHEEEDRARHQLRRAQKAQREVTQQLAALQRVARRINAEHQLPAYKMHGHTDVDDSGLSAQSDQNESGDSDHHEPPPTNSPGLTVPVQRDQGREGGNGDPGDGSSVSDAKHSAPQSP